MQPAGVKLTPKWQLDAALLSRPVDLTPLVSMSRADPDSFLDDGTLLRLVTSLLNEKNEKKSSKDTKLDVLNILANVALGSRRAISEVRGALGQVSEWFDEFLAAEEASRVIEPELNKAMVLLLARCWDYRLKTEDVLELTKGERRIALCTVVGLLEDGETYSTELRQRQRPGQGKMGQWEHELVCHRYEKPLMLQICRLLRGFTHPGTYFESNAGSEENDLALYSVEKFAEEMDSLLEITMASGLVEKLSVSLFDCLFEDREFVLDTGDAKAEMRGMLDEFEHTAVASVHAFLQNLYFYASRNTDEYRRHLLMGTLLIPHLVLPYLDRCVLHATLLNTRAEAYRDMLEGDAVAEMALHNPNLVKGMAATLRTLILASFRAPATQFVVSLLRRLNPTIQLLRASAFCRYHDYIFALICVLNINMGVLDFSAYGKDSEEQTYAAGILGELSRVYASMDSEKQLRVIKRLATSSALPIARDTPSYSIVMSLLEGGDAGQLDYVVAPPRLNFASTADFSSTGGLETESRDFQSSRLEAKRQHDERLEQLRRMNVERSEAAQRAEPKAHSAFQIAVKVANSDAKESKAFLSDLPDLSTGNSGLRLLGDLPSLSGGRGITVDRDVAMALELRQPVAKSKSVPKPVSDAKASALASGIPEEFLCAINGHMMKDPISSPSTGLVYERATIELWLKQSGSICPVTNMPIDKNELVPNDDLRNRIKRFQIRQMTQVSSVSDDLYDF